jgi:hypothetical protein
MDNWIFLLLFIFSTLICVRNAFLFITSLFANNPQKYLLNYKELIFLGLAISYFVTYLIN